MEMFVYSVYFIFSVFTFNVLEGCPDSWSPFEGNCYKVFEQRVTWTDALSNCESEGASLVAISSEEESTFVRDLRRLQSSSCVDTWIGFNDRDNYGDWKWTSNSATHYTNWYPGQPNHVHEHCVVIKCDSNEKWRDYLCSHYFYMYVCETGHVDITTLQPTTTSIDEQLEVLVNRSSQFDSATSLDDLILIANDLYYLSTLQTSPTDFVKVIDEILEFDDKFQNSENQTQARNASVKIISALDNQITQAFQMKANFTVAENPNIGLKAATFDKNLITNDLQFSATKGNELLLGFGENELLNRPTEDILLSVSIPADVLTTNITEQPTSMRQVSFVVFHRSGLFFLGDGLATNDSNEQTTIWREVVRVKVEQIESGKLLDGNVMYNFQNVELDGKACFRARCSYTEALSNVLREGCATSDNGNGDVSCSCNRLGHVALLLDPVREEGIGKEHILTLHFLSIILFSLSAVLLIIILLVYLSNKKIRQRAQYKVLICLFFSLAVFDTIYIASIFLPSSVRVCKAIGVALHYFLLTSVMWMGGEVFTLYINIVPKTKFDPDNQTFVKKLASVCFLLPLVPVIAGAVDSFKMDCVENEYQCFMLSGNIFYATLVAPVSLILLVNVVLFVRILYTLYTKTNKSKTTRFRRLTRHVLTIFILAGVTWCLAFFSLDYGGAIAFNYLFTILNGLQGIVIFILFFVLNKEVKKLLSKNRVVRSIRYGFRTPKQSNTDPNVQHFKQNQQILEDPSPHTIGATATSRMSL